jgi:hypothetical protein
MIAQILDAVFRHGLTAVGTFIAERAYQIGDMEEMTAGAVVAGISLAQSIYQKVEDKRRNGEQVLTGRLESFTPISPVTPAPLVAEELRAREETIRGQVVPPIGSALVVAAMLCGCVAGGNRAVPGNHIKGFIAGQPFEIENPKNTTMTGVLLSHTSGTNTFFLSIEKISSTNDPQVIDKAYAGQAHVMAVQWQGLNETLKQVNEIGQRAGKGVATGGASELISNAKTQGREDAKDLDTLTRRYEANVIRDPRTGAAAAIPTGREGPPVSNGTEGTKGTDVVAALRNALDVQTATNQVVNR